MTAYDTVLTFLTELGATPVRKDPSRSQSVWKIGTSTVSVAALPDGTLEVAEILVSSRALPQILDAIGEFQARRLAAHQLRTHRPGGSGTSEAPKG